MRVQTAEMPTLTDWTPMLSALTGVVDSRSARKELKKRTASFITDLSVPLPPILISLFLALSLYVDADRKEEAALMSLVLLNHWIYSEEKGGGMAMWGREN